ncbi:MAG: InlB B-repeat-containing protein [Clostridia bacterium]|nr:InlB B-repeat-containing protein [Clostridia bacterium]
MKFSEKIVFMRKKRKISQDRLAKKMGVSRQTVYKWEADLNTPEFNKIEKLAEILGISYNLLLDDSIDLEEYFNEDNSDKSNEEENENLKIENESSKKDKTKSIVILSVISFVVLSLIVTSIILVSNFLKNNGFTNDSTNSDTNSDTSTDTESDTEGDTFVYVYFDAKGGELDEKTRKIAKGGKIGNLPIPTKENHIFVGWENLQGTRIDINATVGVDVILYAVYEDASKTVHLSLDANGGEATKTEISVSVGSYVYDYLPTPTHKDGLTFLGWFDERGVKIMPQTILSSSQVLTAFWDELENCPKTKGNHNFDKWNYGKMSADCENDGYATRYCLACYYEEIRITEKAKGHNFDEVTYETMSETGECSECGYKRTIRYINLNDTCIGNTMIEGDVYGKEYYYAVFDGEFDSFVGPGLNEGEEMTVYIYLKEYTYIDYIFTQGFGEMDFTISVITPPTDEYVEICQGSFQNEVQRFEVKRYVLAIKIHTNNAKGHWQEIALALVPKDEK